MPKAFTAGLPRSRDGRNGQIVTFYSYKGGTGRTMALANVAWILAANGYRVLVADWDLEAPGLHRFFHPFLDENEARNASGVIDLIRQYERAAASAAKPEDARRLIAERARVQTHALSLAWEFPDDGSLEFLSPGRQNLDYAATLAALDWDNFYEKLNGGEFLDAVRADMKRHYDYVLIDSRTGLSDIAGICTILLPDVLVDCFTFSTQGIEGAAQVARLIEDRHKDRKIRILPVPMRVDPAEKEKVEAGYATAIRLFGRLPADMSEGERREYWAAVEVPYRAFYAYEETLAIFGDAPGSPSSLLSAFERLTAQITNGAVTALPPMDEYVRNRTKQYFTRRAPLAGDHVIVEYGSEDQVWGEWIADVVRAAGITVTERRLGEPVADHEPGRTLTVVSASYIARHRVDLASRAVPELPVYVTTTRPPAAFSAALGAFLADVPEREAVERLHRLLSISDRLRFDRVGGTGTRYPGSEPKINTAPVPNVRFTGREDILRQVHEQLTDTSDMRPVTLLGLGGIGKTHVAIEYVHRFRTSYDLIWWLDCGQPQFIDASLVDLGARLRTEFGLGEPIPPDELEAARQVLHLLEQIDTSLRWLLIYDNAEDTELVRPFVPTGGGNVLITSRNRDWDHAHQFRPVQIDVFTRQESVEHLRKRIPIISEQDAADVAELLGDLPLAVATAGAWLAESGMTVATYKRELESRAPQTLSLSHLDDYQTTVPLPQTWDLSLNLLAERSPAAARLFELCSAMAPNIALELLYSAPMAKVLEPFDAELAEPMIIGRLIKEIDRTALIKIDHNSGQILIHRLVQQVVQSRMSPEQAASARRDVHQALAAFRPSRDVDNPETWARFRMIWPHLDYSQAVTSAEEAVRQLFIDRVRYMWLRRDLDRGHETASEIEHTWEEMLAAAAADSVTPLHRQLLRLRFNLANIFRDLARFAEARVLDERVLAEQRELLGTNHPHTLMSASGLAADLRATGDYRGALAMDELTYPAWTELFGDSNARTLAAANNLAVSYRLTGNFASALRLDEDTLRRLRATLGSSHPQTMLSTMNVIRDLMEAGDYGEAAARTEILRAECVNVLGAESIHALNAEVLLGIALREVGKPQQAEPHFRTAYAGLTSQSWSSISEALACRLSHAVNLTALHRVAEAEAEIREVLRSYRHRLGPSHPNTLLCQVDLASALHMRGNLEDAMRTIELATSGLSDQLGAGHPYALAAQVAQGVLLADHGELEQAEQVESLVTERSIAALGPDHPASLRARANLLLTRRQLGIPGVDAERDEVIDRLSELLGPGHSHVEVLHGERRLMPTLDPQPF